VPGSVRQQCEPLCHLVTQIGDQKYISLGDTKFKDFGEERETGDGVIICKQGGVKGFFFRKGDVCVFKSERNKTRRRESLTMSANMGKLDG